MRHVRSISEPGLPIINRRTFDEACADHRRAMQHSVSPAPSPEDVWYTPALSPVAGGGPTPTGAHTSPAAVRLAAPRRAASEPAVPSDYGAQETEPSPFIVPFALAPGRAGLEAGAASFGASPGKEGLRPPHPITPESYRQPAHFVGEPVIFWAARLLVEDYAREAAVSPDRLRPDMIAQSAQSAWRALAQQPIHHLLYWPDDAYERRGLWREGQHSWAFHLNPGTLGRRLADWFQVPHPVSSESDERRFEGLRLLFEHVPPSTLMPWSSGFHLGIHADLWKVDQTFSTMGSTFPTITERVVVGPPLMLAGAPWVAQLDPSVVKVIRAPGMPDGVPREAFEQWVGAPRHILEALPAVLQHLLMYEPIPMTDSVRRLIALCALSQLPAEQYGVAIGDPVEGYQTYNLEPRGDHANMLDFIAASAPSLNEYFAIIVGEGIFMEVHADGLPRLGATLKMIVEEMQTSLHRIVRLFASRDDAAGLTKVLRRLDDWCFAGQVRVIEEILVELGESVLDADAVRLPVFHPADSDRDKAARLAGAYRNAQLRRFADVYQRSMTDPRLADDRAFTASYFTPQTLRTFLAGQEDIQDRSDAGLKELIRYLSEELVIFG